MPDQIKHFLVKLEVSSGEVQVESFGTDYEGALRAYADEEQVGLCNSDLDIVLLSADSLDTIKQTHSSYFNGTGGEELKGLLSS